MSFGMFLTVVVPYLFLFFVVFIGLPVVIAGVVRAGYEHFKSEEQAKAPQGAAGAVRI
ncbi:hypothetical protein [Ferrimonas balearica]|uniref:hypothetical protein n=1 Tax=Ferrimonas balearica TaxID=44012 RepID=UPI001C9A06E0|nr:hypothetical protein [Ferrimonas balearica]MBY5993585.1 hypothetical protein [Ferrimonas balearica]